MPHRTFTLDEVVEYLRLPKSDVERLVREDAIPYQDRGGRRVFPRQEIEAWVSQRILGASEKRLDAIHQRTLRDVRAIVPGAALMPELLAPGHIDLALPGKTRPSVIREMVGLAERTGRLFDPREFLGSVEAREALYSTAIEGGVALLHARHYAEYRFEGSFLVLGRTLQPVGFGAPDGRATDLFFLVCCDDERIHLHTLARLCMIAAKTKAIAELRAATDSTTAAEVLLAAERAVLPTEDSAGGAEAST